MDLIDWFDVGEHLDKSFLGKHFGHSVLLVHSEMKFLKNKQWFQCRDWQNFRCLVFFRIAFNNILKIIRYISIPFIFILFWCIVMLVSHSIAQWMTGNLTDSTVLNTELNTAAAEHLDVKIFNITEEWYGCHSEKYSHICFTNLALISCASVYFKTWAKGWTPYLDNYIYK